MIGNLVGVDVSKKNITHEIMSKNDEMTSKTLYDILCIEGGRASYKAVCLWSTYRDEQLVLMGHAKAQSCERDFLQRKVSWVSEMRFL